jgi:uncharacterized protein (DUF934 family)
MILTVGAYLTAFGFVAFIIGSLFDMKGVRAAGGVIIFGVGLMISFGGVEYKAGETKTQVDNSTTEIENTYRQANTPTSLSLSLLVMLLGGALTLRALGEQAT